MTGELTDKTSQSYRWWFESHNSTSGTSPWLQSTLSDLELKTKAILDIIEGDADSFAQRAEMYYMKRPQLVSMVEDLCRAQKSLAEQFDRLMHRRSLLLASSIPFPISSANSKLVSDPVVEEEEEDINLISSFKKDGSKTATVSLDESNVTELSNDEYSEGESCDSEVDDPAPELIIQAGEESFDEGSGFAFGEEMMFSYDMDDVKGVREKLERLQEEFETQKNQLNQKEREIDLMKREVSEKGNEMMVIRKELERLRLEVYLLKRKRDVLGRDTAETPKNQLSQKEREIEKVDEMMDIRNELERLRRKRYVNETETAETQVSVTRLSTEIEMQHRNQNSCLRLQLNEREYEIRELRRQIVAEKENKRLLQEQIQDLLSSESELLKQKDEEKREVIRQMSLAIEMLKDENLFLKKQHSHSAIARQHSNKNNMPKIRNHLRNSQAFKGLPKFFHHWSLFGQASVVPL